MIAFTDDTGVQWKLDLTYGTIEKIKDTVSLDLDMLVNDPEEFGSLLLKKPKSLIELLWCICESQATQAGISPKDFGFIFTRRVLDEATEKLMAAIVDFYQRSAVGRAILNRMPQMIKAIDEKLEQTTNQVIDEKLEEISSKKVTV